MQNKYNNPMEEYTRRPIRPEFSLPLYEKIIVSQEKTKLYMLKKKINTQVHRSTKQNTEDRKDVGCELYCPFYSYF